VSTVKKPWWQQATALVTVSTGGVITGFNFAPGAAALTTPASVPLHQLAFEQAARPDTAGMAPASDAQLRAAIVNVARYYLKLAKTKTPAQVEALIWGEVSGEGTDHGPSCAAFASLTLELAAHTTGLRSWVTGGTTYPWPLPAWADVRVDTNPASPQITSVAADAQAHGRWHPLGDGYVPQPGDWVLYDGHVAVVTSYAGGVLDTIAADSLPGLTVNAHYSAAPLADQGVAGFVDNGNLQPATGDPSDTAVKAAPPPRGTAPANVKAAPAKAKAKPAPAPAAAATVPGVPGAVALAGTGGIPGAGPAAAKAGPSQPAKGAVPGVLATGRLLGEPASSTSTTPKPKPASAPASAPANVRPAPAKPPRPAASAPSAPAPDASAPSAPALAAPTSAASPSQPPASSAPRPYATPGTRDQQAFIGLVAPGAVAARQRYGIPASVTIAQAIEESAWGQSSLAARYHNLFGVKGAGPAGSVSLPTQEYENGSWVTVDAQFAVYRNDAESIAGHAELLAGSGYYARAMADRAYPDAFANDLTGVYATDPRYGANLIALMKLYNLYQYDTAPAAAPAATPPPAPARSRAPAGGGIPEVLSYREVGSGADRGTGNAKQQPVRNNQKSQNQGTYSERVLVSRAPATRYQAQLPQAVRTALFATAKGPLGRGEQLYRDVAATTGGSWKLLAAADWMQCKADPRYSPVQGEKLGTVNADGTSYPTRTAALAQCAADLIELSSAVYGIDLTARRPMSVRELAAAFAAFRWGALLKRHGVSPLEFPYSVAGLTTAHQKMHWPPVNATGAPDRPGSRFRQPFGAVPVVLSLGYPATI
jgi:flagellum-specific peptidoglycan hydrolase FlgJ